MDFKSLWVGDEVFVKSLQQKGYWDGFHSADKAKIKVNHKSIVISLTDIEKAKEEVVPLELNFDDEPKEIKTLQESTIDLHINRLNPSLEHQAPQLILRHQLAKCKEFIEQSIVQRKLKVLIIHGKGTGALKLEVQELLKDYKIQFTFEKNNSGAIEVWFSY